MKPLICFLISICTIFSACRDYEAEKKIDPHLRVKMEELIRSGQTDKKLLILFKVIEELNEAHQIVLQKKGIHIQANIRQIYTAVASTKSIYELAKMRFVIYIEPSKEMKRKMLIGTD